MRRVAIRAISPSQRAWIARETPRRQDEDRQGDPQGAEPEVVGDDHRDVGPGLEVAREGQRDPAGQVEAPPQAGPVEPEAVVIRPVQSLDPSDVVKLKLRAGQPPL